MILNYFMIVKTMPSSGGIILTILDFSSIILFLIGGIIYYKIACKLSKKSISNYCLIGVISCFIGGLPNAIDKCHWAFGLDTIFNSNWMFTFVGIGFCFLSLSIVMLKKRVNKNLVLTVTIPSILLFLLSVYPKPLKYVFMMIATIGMIIYYVYMYIVSKKYINKVSIFYLISIFMMLVLTMISSICKDFSNYTPNIIAQTSNNLGYFGYIYANIKWLKVLKNN